MIRLQKGVLGAVLAFVSTTAMAQAGPETAPPSETAEVAVGVLHHGTNFHPLGSRLMFDLPDLLPGEFYEGSEEDGTVDVQIAYRTAPLRILLKPRLTAKAQINTAGRTSFFSAGAEWRQHILRGRVYGQAGIGVTVIDGYRFTPDPFEPDISNHEAWRRYEIYRRRTSFGSKILFNPNASIGVRLDRRWAVELAWEHFSHRRIFSDTNPGIDNVGIRIVRRLGR
ncbi:acyloxyacyl hydrolase [Sphingomonas sp. T9W2]|uniref:acyloxyacyl hydrolase n=1 Tax=Sphingomonas sp. T9W2 TaxID=3143183 RepID=UPI0031F546AB